MKLVLLVVLSPLCYAAITIRERTRTIESPDFIKRIHRGIKALDWEPKDNWIHHDPFNVADGFHLEWDEVMEARDATIKKYGLRQI